MVIKDGHNLKEITTIDIGGGFPGIDRDVKFEDIAKQINMGITDFFADNVNIKFIAEPGRYFPESSHTLVFNVIGKKNIIDETTGEKIIIYYLNDGIYGSFGCIYFDHHNPTILPFNERNDKVHWRSR